MTAGTVISLRCHAHGHKLLIREFIQPHPPSYKTAVVSVWLYITPFYWSVNTTAVVLRKNSYFLCRIDITMRKIHVEDNRIVELYWELN